MVENKIVEKPEWLKKRVILNNSNINDVKNILVELNLHTVCQSAKCPNIYECFSKKTATFMLMGNICTRNCAFCGVEKGIPSAIDNNEPENVARASLNMMLDYIVLTSVTRDDVQDGGAKHFGRAVSEIKKLLPESKVECLIPDFAGNVKNLETLLNSNPDVLNHNIETIERNYSIIRNKADYKRSINVLKNSKKIKKDIITKSGFMLGLGENKEETVKLLYDLHEADCDIVTIGQYLSPGSKNFPVYKYYSPEEFEEIKKEAEKFDFKYVVSGVFVRSSYNAAYAYNKVKKQVKNTQGFCK
ncbi:MAG: lipoyl synthase [Actinobacteria bacterium]|nr:lipoyl synthase [Actinomycetota bacterium]